MVTIDVTFFKTLGSLAEAIEPYLKDVVFIGGVANALYEFHPYAKPSGSPVLMTKDVDLATEQKIPSGASRNTLAALLDKAGFKVDPDIQMALKLTKFRLVDGKGKADNNYEVEFLCPLTGGPPGPDYIEVQAGITATPLTFMDLLMHEPWELELKLLPGLEGRREIILVPNQGVYVVQKFITMFRRQKRAARQKDAFYIYEFCLKFRDSLGTVNDCIERLVSISHYKKVKSFRNDFSRYFESQTGEGIANIMNEIESLPFDGVKTIKPDQATVHAIIQRLADTWVRTEKEKA